MATSAYMSGRKKYHRPQALLFSNNPGSVIDGKYVPDNNEFGVSGDSSREFIIVSDHNRGPLDFGVQRIENRQRMVNGRMRSYFIADKRTLTISWQNLPSRSFGSDPNFNTSTGKPDTDTDQYTIDGGAGGGELLEWYETHYGTFYVFLSYDKFPSLGLTGANIDASYNRLTEYSEVLEMYITDFTYSVDKRGRTNHDLWNISITLEEA
jgi:hypothetical protein